MNNLYQISSFDYDADSGTLNSAIVLNREHPVFKGHFPGNPILPGVCTVQIAKELLCKALAGHFRLTRASQIKYLGFVSPLTTPEIRFQMAIKQTGTMTANCSVTVKAGENAVCSFRGDYIRSEFSSD